ncbi:hypothetical protein [Thermococcus sp.]|uniref:hypothetical protein n=1 Tax=Thermococcus sp. TaxID=35749 RepID=UPI002612684C|nr:hypothetical protein [Thermococcus sp.]
MFTLFVNGTPVDDKTITVKPEGNVVAWMECNPDVISLGESTTCLTHLELRSNETVTLNFKKVEFGGKIVWPNGPSSINVPVNATTLNLTNMREDLTVTITINNELADYYFNKKPLGWGSYIDRLAGYSYLIRVFFDDNVVTSDIIEIMGKSASLGEKAKVTFEVIGTTYSVSQRCVERLGQLEIVIGGPLGSALAKVTPVVDMISWGLTLRDFINWLRAPMPADIDGNNVIGDNILEG